MKIEKQTDTTFKPVTINITFETQEELDAIYNIMGYNVTIPNFIAEESPKTIGTRQVNIFKNFMTSLHKQLLS